MYVSADILEHFCSCMSTLQCHGLLLGCSGSLVKLSGQRLKSTWYHFSESHNVIPEVDRDFWRSSTTSFCSNQGPAKIRLLRDMYSQVFNITKN